MIDKIRKQIEAWMPDNPEGDEHISGERMAFRSVLHLLDEIEHNVVIETNGRFEDSKVAPNYDMQLVIEPTTIPYGESGLKYNDKVRILVLKNN